jgi:hypothetical protein
VILAVLIAGYALVGVLVARRVGSHVACTRCRAIGRGAAKRSVGSEHPDWTPSWGWGGAVGLLAGVAWPASVLLHMARRWRPWRLWRLLRFAQSEAERKWRRRLRDEENARRERELGIGGGGDR